MPDERDPKALRAAVMDVGGEEIAVLRVTPRPRRLPAGLTEAETEVLELLLMGASNRDIAGQRGTTERTVANQVASIFRRAGVVSRSELTRYVVGED